jgi:hypothetical protein
MPSPASNTTILNRCVTVAAAGKLAFDIFVASAGELANVLPLSHQ